MDTTLDIPGLILRARRLADLSQRDLADVLGVHRSCVGKWETGKTTPDLHTFVRILGLGHLAVAVLDEDGGRVNPFPESTIRDNANRRFPAHLDLRAPEDVPGYRAWVPRNGRAPATGWYHWRRERDRRRKRGTPENHFTQETLERFRRELQERRDILNAARRAAREEGEAPECQCFDVCFEAWCVPECPCNCEPRSGR